MDIQWLLIDVILMPSRSLDQCHRHHQRLLLPKREDLLFNPTTTLVAKTQIKMPQHMSKYETHLMVSHTKQPVISTYIHRADLQKENLLHAEAIPRPDGERLKSISFV